MTGVSEANGTADTRTALRRLWACYWLDLRILATLGVVAFRIALSDEGVTELIPPHHH